MATILSGRKSTYGAPYAFYTVDVTTSSRRPDRVYVTVRVTARLQYAESWLGTGLGLTAGIYIGGAWHDFTLKGAGEIWRGTASHSASAGFWVNASASTSLFSGVSFRCLRTGGDYSAQLNAVSCSSVPVPNVTSSYSKTMLLVSDTNQVQAKATLSGLPASVGYVRDIRWYNGNEKIGVTRISADSAAESFSQVFQRLEPNTDYSIKAMICYGDAVLTEKSAMISTPQETGSLTLGAGATYITAEVSGMFGEPNYERTVEFYVKKAEDSDYMLFSAEKSQKTYANMSITGLISNASYDVMVNIKNGDRTLVILTGSKTTAQDASLVPTAKIESVTQKLGTRNCILAWITDKAVAGTTYKVEAKADGETSWITLATMVGVESPKTVTSHVGNKSVKFRISAENQDVTASTINYSSEFEFYVRDDFVWDTPKTKGAQMIITAAEWNRLRDYAIARNAELGSQIEILPVRVGDPITAAAYNEMKRAISLVNDVGIIDKTTGDAIKAADIDALRIAINKTNET